MDYSTIIKKHLDAGKVEIAIDYCQQAISVYEHDNNFEKLANQIHNLAGILDWYKSDYSECIKLYKKEIEIRQQNNIEDTDSAYLGLGTILNFTRNEDEAIKYLNLVRLESKNIDNHATALNILADIYCRKDLELAKKYIEIAINEFNDEENEYMKCHAYLSKALILGLDNDLSEAFKIVYEELDFAKKKSEEGLIGTAYLKLAELMKLDGNKKKMNDYALIVNEIAERNNWEIMKREIKEIIEI